MRTIIFKPFLIVALLCSVALATMNAGEYINGGEIRIELHPGFTIEDIIQDLHDNANITNVTVTTGNGTVFSIKFNPKQIDSTFIKQFLDAHPGVDVIDNNR